MRSSAYIIEIEQSEKYTGKTMNNTRHEIAKLITQNETLEKENQQLKKQKDDVVEYIKESIKNPMYAENIGANCDGKVENLDKLLIMLGEIDE